MLFSEETFSGFSWLNFEIKDCKLSFFDNRSIIFFDIEFITPVQAHLPLQGLSAILFISFVMYRFIMLFTARCVFFHDYGCIIIIIMNTI